MLHSISKEENKKNSKNKNNWKRKGFNSFKDKIEDGKWRKTMIENLKVDNNNILKISSLV